MIKVNKLLKKHRNDWNLVLREAKTLNDEGDVQSAILIYESFLNRNSSHPAVLEALACAYLKAQHFSKSLPLFQRLAKLDDHASYWLHMGICQASINQHEEAQESFRYALKLQPDYALAHNNFGKLLGDTGSSKKAMPHFFFALVIQPSYLDAYLNAGVILQNDDQNPDALNLLNRANLLNPGHLKARYHLTLAQEATGGLSGEPFLQALDKIIEQDPHFVDPLTAQADWLRRHGQPEAAIDRFERALKLDSNNKMARIGHGILLNDQQRYSEAIRDFDAIIASGELLSEAFVNRGTALMGMGRNPEALLSAQAAILLDPALPEAHANLGTVLGGQQRFDEALDAFSRSSRLNPLLVETYLNRSDVLRRMSCDSEARRDILRAIVIAPQRCEAFVSFALLEQEKLDIDSALLKLDRALLLNEASPEAHFNRGIMRLMDGNLMQGAYDYEWRWKAVLKGQSKDYQCPLWLGDTPLTDKSILIVSEQGLGDAIQMARYLPLLEQMAGKVTVEIHKSLIPLFESLPGSYQWVARGEKLPRADLYCPIMSLPLSFKTELDTVPSAIPYLYGSDKSQLNWKTRLGSKTKPRIGLAWSGNPKYSNDQKRSMRLDWLTRLIDVQGFEFHVIQNEVRDDDLRVMETKPQMHFHAEHLKTFEDTAGLLMQMDLVISVDTSVAHLAGAMGCPTWLLLSYVPDSRWLLNREDSPWYPTIRLFRQGKDREWGPVVAQLKQMLTHLFPAGH